MALFNQVVLVDRDGVLNKDRRDYVKNVSELQWEPGAREAIASLAQAQWKILVVTNQAGVGKGLVRLAELEAIHTEMQRQLLEVGGEISGWYVCPHLDEDRCLCRKPLPGLIEQAQTQWGFEPRDTWFVGDSLRDIQTAVAAGCKPALVRTGHGANLEFYPLQTKVFADLNAFAKFLLESPGA